MTCAIDESQSGEGDPFAVHESNAVGLPTRSCIKQVDRQLSDGHRRPQRKPLDPAAHGQTQ